MAQSFLLGENFVNKLRSTIDRVDGTPLPGAGGAKGPAILEDSQQQGKTFRIGTFDGEWSKGSDKTVTFTSGGSSATVTATNLFTTVGEQNATNLSCGIAKDGGTWYLVEADIPTKCTSVVSNVTAEKLTLVTNVAALGQVVSSLSGTVVTGVSCVNGEIVVTTADISQLAVKANLASMVSVTKSDMNISLNVTTQNISVLSVGECDADN